MTNSEMVQKLIEQGVKLHMIAGRVASRNLEDVDELLGSDGPDEDEIIVERANILLDVSDVCDELVKLFIEGQTLFQTTIGDYEPPTGR